MMKEIERKFLVNSTAFKSEATNHYKIIQGFLNTHPERTVRVRLKDKMGILTVKGKSSDDGTERFEWETILNREDAIELLALCEPGIIEKERYEVDFEGHLFEVDVFLKDNEGLIIAEIELNTSEQYFEKPEWLGDEVTGDLRYYNSQLSKNPFKTW